MTTKDSRITIADLPRGAYDHAEHHRLGDKGRRRYHPYSFDFDSTPMNLDEPAKHWVEAVRKNHLENRERLIERLKAEHGERNLDTIVANMRDLGPKGMSLISYHNAMHQQAKRSLRRPVRCEGEAASRAQGALR